MHFAYSSVFKGAAITAGGPYYCALGSASVALVDCMSSPNSIDLDMLISKAQTNAKNGDIDNLSNLAGSKVYLFSGTQDSTVL